MTKRRRALRHSRDEQRAVVERFAASGETQKEFCEREGIALSSLQRWRQRAAGVRASDFIELRPEVPEVPVASVPGAGCAVEVVFPGGTCLRLRG